MHLSPWPGIKAWLPALGMLLLLATGPASAQDIDDAQWLLRWDQDSARASQWCVRDGVARCFDLLDGGDGLDARHLSVDGRVGGEPLADSRLRITHHFTHVEESQGAWRLRLLLRAENISSRSLTPGSDDRLWLQLGPGLGNQAVPGLGYAEGLYSYIEAVALQTDALQQMRPESIRFSALSSDERAVDWFGLHGRYFALLLAPLDGHNRARAGVALAGSEQLIESDAGQHQVILRWPLLLPPLAAGESQQWQFEIYAGPKDYQLMRRGEIAYDAIIMPDLWRWLRALALGLIWLLSAIHSVIPSWGLAIITLAVLVRLLMYPIARNALRQQQRFVAVQQQLAPALAEIKARYSGEEQSERILALYAEHRVSPLAGLKPLLIVLLQLPILIALFHGLGSAWALRDASFLGIPSLAEPDRLLQLGVNLPVLGDSINLLPILMTLVTLAALKLTPAPASSAAARRRQNLGLVAMALAFLVLFYPFPAGMVLYWTAANVLHIAQHCLVARRTAASAQ